MTPSNKGAVIERAATEHDQAEDHSPADAAEAVSDAPRRSDQVENGNRAAPGNRNDDRLCEGGISGRVADRSLDDVVGEAIPLQERLIVSPCSGRFRAAAAPGKANGEYILEGQKIGSVMSSDREVVEVKSAFSGWIMGYLVPEGSPVRAAEPVAWLRPH